MKIRFTHFSVIALFFMLTPNAQARTINYLYECWTKQVKPVKEQYFTFSYNETFSKLYHDLEPWKKTTYSTKGDGWMNSANFVKLDTLNTKRRSSSVTQFNKTDLLNTDYGTKKLSPVTVSMLLEEIFKSARYCPLMLIDYFMQQKILLSNESTNDMAVYKTTIYKTSITLYIQKTTFLLSKISMLEDDALYGDVTNTFLYSDYTNTGELFYAKRNDVEEINGKLKDEVTIFSARLVNEAPKAIEKPVDFKLKDDTETPLETKVEKHSDHIYTIELKHANDRVLLAEFSNFLLIEGAPLSSKNGELIIAEAKKIAPGKPIRYFTFGHHHPHYIGGMRPFIHKGATILSVPGDKDYINYLAAAPHTLNPDSLQLQPKAVKIEELSDQKTITDGAFEMTIYFIGSKSEHTNDYLIYYFPKEKLVYEDDLVWIAKTGEIKKASGRQAGLYNAVKALGLDVKTIIQAWPASGEDTKTIIPFEELEASVNAK